MSTETRPTRQNRLPIGAVRPVAGATAYTNLFYTCLAHPTPMRVDG
ncbi:hypothetical protein [Spirosoma aerolatum]|nr:hypothetical protein [Spirosoma aerolatum]